MKWLWPCIFEIPLFFYDHVSLKFSRIHILNRLHLAYIHMTRWKRNHNVGLLEKKKKNHTQIVVSWTRKPLYCKEQLIFFILWYSITGGAILVHAEVWLAKTSWTTSFVGRAGMAPFFSTVIAPQALANLRASFNLCSFCINR